MAFFCNFCSFSTENKTTVSLINEDSKVELGEDEVCNSNNKKPLKNKNSNIKVKQYHKNALNKSSPEKDNNGNSIFDIKMPYICLFCGGESCRYENPSKDIKSNIEGLIANLYFDCVYASQRPCTKLINNNNLIKIFKEKKIKLIVNCQINGEHPYCGPNKGLEKDCGFSYSPSVFISEGIEVLCKGFQDLKNPYTFNFILDVVKRMAFIIKYKKGRVLVHCHAGNGRTGIVNVCFFMFYFNLSYHDALKEVRSLRKKGVEKPEQELYCQKFEQYIKSLKDMFPSRRKKIGDFISNQKIIDYNYDKNKYIFPSIVISYYFKNNKRCMKNKNEIYKKIIDINYIPKIIFDSCEKIVEQVIINKISLIDLYNILNGKNEITEIEQNQINQIKAELKKYDWKTFENIKDLNVISEILFMWLNNQVIYCISPKKIENIIIEFINLYLTEKENIISEGNRGENLEKDMGNNIKKLFVKYVNNIRHEEEIKIMIKTIKIHLTKVEYEIIKYLSLFLQIIYPTNKNNEKSTDNNNEKDLISEYKRLFYKLSLFLLGYNLDKFNSNPDFINPTIEIIHAKMLIFIFELFIFFYNNDITSTYPNDEDIFFIFKNKVHFQSIKNYL